MALGEKREKVSTTQDVETPEQMQAFQVYYAMGSDRGYRGLAKKIGVHATTIARWAKKFNWQERVKQTDALVTEDVVQQTARATIQAKEQSKMINQLLKDRFHDEVREGKIKIRHIKDYIDLDKHDLLVRGEATERHESVNVEIKGYVKDMLEIMGKRVAALPEREVIEVKASIMEGEDDGDGDQDTEEAQDAEGE
jgi:hypothetical protein